MMKKISISIATIIFLIALLIPKYSMADSFTFVATPSKTNILPGEEITITLSIKDIDVGVNGINTVEAVFEYNETLFETITQSSFTGLNNWSITYNSENTAQKGKMLGIIIASGVTTEQEIATVKVRVKNTVTLTADLATNIKIKNIATNNGREIITDTDKTIPLTIKSSVVNENENNNNNNENNNNENNNNTNNNENNNNENNNNENNNNNNTNNNENNNNTNNNNTNNNNTNNNNTNNNNTNNNNTNNNNTNNNNTNNNNTNNNNTNNNNTNNNSTNNNNTNNKNTTNNNTNGTNTSNTSKSLTVTDTKVDNTTSSDGKIPQTGVNDSVIIIAIIALTAFVVRSAIKYKKSKI